DRAIAVAFNRVWSTDRDKTAMKFFDELTSRAHTEQEFSVAAPPGSTAYTKLDRVLCAYDLAGELMKFGDLNPTLFFEQWGSAASIWEKSSAWVATIRKSSPSGGGYDSAEWLANYEQQWHAAHPSH
ncbi:MAG TPA: hypothetical protein VET48_09020, partial [Steroidobacteraceae bacterium]|nr:hypothetical protein [Steroidobacteraceae bacterium]